MNRKKVIQKTNIKYGRQKIKWIKGKIKNIYRGQVENYIR